MGEHHGPDGPQRAAEVDDAAAALLAVWDAAREQATPRLSGPQLNALLVVEREEGINLRGLAGQLRMILSSASRLCDRLVAAGLVERVPGRLDRREIALFLTPSSRALLTNLRTTRREILNDVLNRMTPTGRTGLVQGLTEFTRAATKTETETEAEAEAEEPNAQTA